MTAKTVTDAGTKALSAALPDAEVSGEYHSDLKAWTWLVTVPAPIEDDPKATMGVSRQFVSTDERQEPTDEDIANMVTEIRSTLEGAQA